MIRIPKFLTIFLCAISLLSSAYGQTEKERIQYYVSKYKELAIQEMMRTGVPAAITLAQGILETAGGQSDLAAVANNHFGIKCKSDWTGETMSHDDDAKGECFRKYSSAEESYKDHSDFLKSRPGYAFLFKLDPTDYEGWAKGLKRAGYATSSTYAQQLIRLIVENGLQDYTIAALQGGTPQDETLASTETPAATEQPVVSAAIVVVPAAPLAKRETKAFAYPVNKAFNINEVKVIYAPAGTSLFALANEYNVTFKKMLEYNDLDEVDILAKGQLIFLEKKPKRGSKDVHIVESDETLHDIAQKEGVQLNAILELNRLQKGMQPATGEKIYLKSAAPYTPKLVAVASYTASASM